MKKIIMTLALVIVLSIPASIVGACGRDHHSRHRHRIFQRYYVEQEVIAPVYDGGFEYYHDILGKSKAWYLINIVKLP